MWDQLTLQDAHRKKLEDEEYHRLCQDQKLQLKEFYLGQIEERNETLLNQRGQEHWYK